VSESIVLDPAFTFASIEERLAALGFARDESVRPATPDVVPGEPELAAWTRGGERLTYTFNPVVSLRALAAHGLAAETIARLGERLPLLDTAAVGELLTADEPRRLLLGLFAARATNAGELALVVASLQAHPDRTISRAAESTLHALRAAGGRTSREQTLAVMQILCRRAIPVLAALVGPDGAAALEALRPRAGDEARVFHPAIAERVREAYDLLWRTPPQLDRLVSGDVTLRVDAAPAGMLQEENELSRRFPGGYHALAPYLLPDRVWFVWRYLRGGAESGMRYDGVVLLDDRWVWFPKPYRVVGEIVQLPGTQGRSLP
jgi:hypothetical protein